MVKKQKSRASRAYNLLQRERAQYCDIFFNIIRPNSLVRVIVLTFLAVFDSSNIKHKGKVARSFDNLV